MSSKRVLNVGQCMADHWRISGTLQQQFDAEVADCQSAADALDRLRREAFDLVLVNRVLDADGSSGFELIKQLNREETLQQVPVMLVSNYDDAQQEAMGLGAERGFGKAALGQPHMLDRVKPFLS